MPEQKSDRKTVLILGKYYYPFEGGVEQVTQLYAEHLAKTYRVIVVANAHDRAHGRHLINGVDVHILPRHLNYLSQPISLALWGAIHLSEVDLVHFHGPNPYAATVFALKCALRNYKGKIIVTHHADVFGRRFVKAILNPVYRRIAKRADVVTVTSLKNIRFTTDIPKDVNFRVLPLCIHAQRYLVSESLINEASMWRAAQFGGGHLIGFIGRHARYKGLDVLLRAAAMLDDDVKIAVGGSGPLTAEMKALTHELGIEKRVVFLGQLSHEEKLRLLLAIDVLAFPSTETSEAFGITQLEAMLMGTAVVASDLPTGVTDVSIDQSTALLANPGDAADLASKLNIALRDVPLRDRLSRAAKQHVLNRFSEDSILRQFDGIINELL